MESTNSNGNRLRTGDRERKVQPPANLAELTSLRHEIEPWISALIRSEHLSLLVGSGLTNAVLNLVGHPPIGMEPASMDGTYADAVNERAKRVAEESWRGTPNLEDQVRATLELIGGLRITDPTLASEWQTKIDANLQSFAGKVLEGERALLSALETDVGERARNILSGFLGAFGSRTATRDRLHIFTTNYDRFIEFGLDQSGVWKLDRFVGSIQPQFRASRLDVDMHYSPPGIRGEPRYLEGVVRLTKLHGSVDWASIGGRSVVRLPIGFGWSEEHHRNVHGEHGALLIYPNPAKDVETGEFPYAELFRDFAAAITRPNSVLVTYGYGFGDDHINRVLTDMLTVPSTHLLVIARSDTGGRISRFLTSCGRPGQVSFLIGPDLADLENLVHFYLPKPAVDRVSEREADMLRRRGLLVSGDQGDAQSAVDPAP